MKEISFAVVGIPVAKGRPRFVRRGAYVSTYTPKKTTDYEDLVRTVYRKQCDIYFEEEPLEMIVDLYFEVPKSTSNKKRQMMLKGLIKHTKKPDAENVYKSIADALNKVAYKDDSQIIKVVISKHYGMIPRAEITIRERTDV